jgi:iron complex outermembrane recepter protein
MLLKKTIIVLLAWHTQVLAYSQSPCNAIFSGQIQDESHYPVVGAAILLMPQNTGQQSDYSGNFRFENLCPGNYKVKVQYLGYQDMEFELDLKGSVTRVIHIKELVTELKEVVIEHHDQTHTEHSHNFVQMNEKQLSETAGKTLGESLKEVSGVNSIQTGPGIFKPVIHGVHSQRVLILNHGIRQEGQQWGAEHSPEVDPFIASNVVIIKDASAIKYGTDALGGVIVVNPPALPERPELGGTINSVIQTNGRSGTLSAMLEGGVKHHIGWGWRIQGTGKKSGDFQTPGYNLTNTGIEELNFSAATGFHKETKGFDVFFSHFQSTIGILKGTSIGSIDDLVEAMERETPQYTTGFDYEISEPRQQVSHNLLKVNGHLETQSGEWRLQYGFQNNNRKEFDIRIGALSKIPSIDLQLNTHTLDGEWETLHSSKRTISFGFNSMYQENKNIYGTRRIPFIPNFTNVSGGVFGVTKLFLDRWIIDLGARFDYRNYSVRGYDFSNTLYTASFDFANISATSGASFQLTKNNMISFSLSSAWRPPHVAELFSLGTHQSAASIEYGLLLNDTTNEVMNISDVSFRTEQAVKFITTYERRDEKLTLAISPYANYIFNYIYLRPLGVTKNIRGVYPYFRYTQTDALFLGTDVTATWQASRHFKVIPKASLLMASDEGNNDFLVFIPSNRYEVALRYEKEHSGLVRNFYLESRTKFVARQTRAPRVITVREIKEAQEQNTDPFQNRTSSFDFMEAPESYWLLDFAAGCSIKREKVQYDLRIASQNTLDTKYREYTNRFRYYADDIGRNVIFSLKFIF